MKSKIIIKDAVENKGYSESDFIRFRDITEISQAYDRCIVCDVDKIRYPIDTDWIVSITDPHLPSFVIVSDEDNVHIFYDGEEGVVEIPELPPKNMDGNEDEAENAREVQDILGVILRDPMVLSGPEDVSDFLALSVYLYKNKLFGELYSVLDPFGYINSIIRRMNEECPGVLSSGVSERMTEKFIKGLLKMNCLNLTPSRCLGEMYLKTVSSMNNGYDSEITRSTYDMAMSFVDNHGVLCFAGMPNHPLVDPNFDGIVESMYKPNIEFLRYISGSHCEFRESSGIDGDMYKNILIFPPWGLRVQSKDSVANSVSSEVSIFEQALDHLEEGGNLVALLPPGFLFNKQFSEVRSRILNDGSLRSIIKVARPFKDSSIEGYLVVISKGIEPSGSIVYVEDPSSIPDGMDLSAYINSHANVDDIFDGIRMLDSRNIDKDNGFTIHLEPFKEFKGIPLEECADVIHGVQVRSSDYYPEGNIAGVPYLRVSDLVDGGIDMKGSRHVPSKFAKVVTRPGDLLLSVHGVIGKCAIVKDRAAIPSSQVVILRPKAFVSSETLLRAISSRDAQEQLLRLSAGSTLRYISMSNLKGIRLVL